VACFSFQILPSAKPEFLLSSPSYFVVSCGGAPLDTVKAYVSNQTNPLRQFPAFLSGKRTEFL
jgi:REP element-mobilizing transposase RayT